jgi:hypothetical protein
VSASAPVLQLIAAAAVLAAVLPSGAAAQATAHDPSQHDMQQMSHDAGGVPMTRRGSGTSWLPDDTPVYAIHQRAGAWMLMAHGSAFVQYIAERGTRGADQAGSINWVMGMAERPLGGGRFGVRSMVSAEPWTIAGCGYPDLLASGEECNGSSIHDRQHPHDTAMELAAEYDRPLRGSVRVHLYGGPAAEPALGPVAFPHRVSAMPNPIAPITHHWFDSSHVSFGVATAGVYGNHWNVEASAFNGREPDEKRTDFDFAALDSWSGRLTAVPTSRWAIQVSGAHLREAEAHEAARVDVDRLTASATYHRREAGRLWANTLGWGRNAVDGEPATNAWLAETSLTLSDRHSWYGRAELAQKSGHDLAVEDVDTALVSKLQGGYTRYLKTRQGLTPGFGASASAALVPSSLQAAYGSRVNGGASVYVTLRVAAAMP